MASTSSDSADRGNQQQPARNEAPVSNETAGAIDSTASTNSIPESEQQPTPPATDSVNANASEQQPSSEHKVTASKSEQDEADPATLLDFLEQELSALSHKNTTHLDQFRSQLQRLKKRLQGSAGENGEDTSQPNETEATLLAKLDVIQSKLSELAEKNRVHQEQVSKVTGELITSLQQALEAGQSHKALPTWDKIQSNIGHTSGKIRSALQELSSPFRAQINELRDWKIFAATEKKQELIQHMRSLLETNVAPQELSKRISKMHKDWKALGQSNDNDKLWEEFKTLSDKAYEPCKEYFKQRKAQMAENLQARRTLCDELEKELEKIDPENIHIGEISKLLSHAEKQWKQHAPVEQSKIKNLQKRYYGLINQLRKHRKSSIRENTEAKQALIDAANKLAESDDNRKAMNEAKNLQKQWQEIGPTTFKDDKKLWSQFRGACDKIFAKRDAESAARKQEQQAAEKVLKQLLIKMEGILQKNDEDFRQARSEFNDLAQQFNAGLDPRQKRGQGKLIDRFNTLKRQSDARTRALPDKKTQALQEAINGITAMLEPLEQSLLENKAIELADEFTVQVSEKLKAVEDKECLHWLQKRLSQLDEKASDLTEQAKVAEASLRELCIAAEIRADMESPKEDQSQRMAMQLQQLKEDFGQSRPSAKDNIRFAQQAELKARSIGPLSSNDRDKLQSRLQQVAARLR